MAERKELKEKMPSHIKQAVRDLHWMARRYADGRCSYAPGMFNGRVRDLIGAGFELGEPLFARDGMGRAFDGLTEEEVTQAEADMPSLHAAFAAEAEVAADRRALAVWNEAVEACAKQADYWGEGNLRVQNEPNRSRYSLHDLQTYTNIAGRGIAKDIRSLKRSDNTESDFRCQAESSTSESAASASPLQSPLIASAEKDEDCWQCDGNGFVADFVGCPECNGTGRKVVSASPFQTGSHTD